MGQDWIRPAPSNGFKPYAQTSSKVEQETRSGSGLLAPASVLDYLSDELIFNILRHLSAEDLSKISKVAKRLYYLSIDYRLWRPLYLIHFSYHQHDLQETDSNYYDYFRECWRKESGDFDKPTITEKLLKLVAKSRRDETFVCDFTLAAKSKDLKVLFLGQSGVGKTSLVSAICGRPFDPSTPPTMGACYLSKKLLVHRLMIKLSCWDVSGGERYTQMVPLYFKDVHVVLAMYSTSQKESVARMKNWVKDVRQAANASLGLALYVIGTKCDLKRSLPTSEVEEWCTEQNLQHFEVSAKTGAGVAELIETIVSDVRRKRQLPD